MNRRLLVISAVAALLTNSADLFAQEGETGPARRNPLVEEMVSQVSRERLEATVRRLAGFGTRHALSDTTSPTRGIGAARRWVFDEFQAISRENRGRLSVSFDWFMPDTSARVPRPVRMANVVAVLTGSTDPGRVYVVCGHLDSRDSDPIDATGDAPGANDDGSGVAAVLEAARVMARFPLDATVVFIATTGEEQALLGSDHWAQQAKEKGIHVAGAIADDMVGNIHGGNGVVDNRTLRVFSEGIPTAETPEQARIRAAVGGENDGPSRQLARQVRRLADTYVVNLDLRLVARRDRYLRGGDHISFNRAGFPAVRLTEPNENYDRQHQDPRTANGVAYGDVVEGVDFDYLAQTTRANVAALAGLALGPAVPENARILTKELSNDTELKWAPSGEADVVGYQICWRETTAPDWQHERFVGNVTGYRFAGVSKDDFIFGVRAVDKDGNLSAAAAPVPSRDE